MKLTIEEGDYLEKLAKHAEDIYGNKWERILKKEALPLPKEGFSQRTEKFEDFNPGKEERIIKQLKQKNILTIREEDADVQKQGNFQEKYGDQNNQFIGVRPKKLEELKQQLGI